MASSDRRTWFQSKFQCLANSRCSYLWQDKRKGTPAWRCHLTADLETQNVTIIFKSPTVTLWEIFCTSYSTVQWWNTFMPPSWQVHYTSVCFKLVNYCPNSDYRHFEGMQLYYIPCLICTCHHTLPYIYD